MYTLIASMIFSQAHCVWSGQLFVPFGPAVPNTVPENYKSGGMVDCWAQTSQNNTSLNNLDYNNLD